MRGVVVSGVLAFAAVLVVAAALRPPGPPEVTPTPLRVEATIKCGVPDPDCQKLASEFIARAQAAYPGRTVASVVVIGYDSYEVCFTDGTCFGEASGGGRDLVGPKAPVPLP